MRNPIRTAGLAGLLFVAVSSVAQAAGFDGHWQGQANLTNGECSPFVIAVSVQNQNIVGKVVQGEDDFRIKGSISSDGKVRGEVTYLWYTVAKLTGKVASGQGNGTWQTVKGKECKGKFEVVQNPNGAPLEIATEPKRDAISELTLD